MRLADSLMRGEGYANYGVPNTSLAPGYPVFLSVVRSVHDSVGAILVTQLTISVVSCYLLYVSVKQRSVMLGAIVFLLMAANPQLARYSTAVMSETFSVFLVAIAVCFISQIEIHGPSLTSCLWLGLALVAAMFSAPHAVFFAIGVLAWMGYRCRNNLKLLAGLACGAATLIVPWQLHYSAARGHLNPFMFDSAAYPQSQGAGSRASMGTTLGVLPDGLLLVGRGSGYRQWLRTWQWTEEEVDLALWNVDQFDKMPARAFASVAEREALTAIVKKYKKLSSEISADEDEYFRRVADTYIDRHSVWYYVVQPALRGIFLWMDPAPMRYASIFQLKYLSPEALRAFNARYGSVKTLNQILKSAFTLVVWGMQAGIVYALASHFIRTKRPYVMIVVAWVVLYTLGSTWATPQGRRNLVLYPALFFLAFYVDRERMFRAWEVVARKALWVSERLRPGTSS